MIGRWAAGALGVLLVSLACAQPPHGAGRGLGGGYGAAHGGEARPGANAYGQQRWGLRPTPSYGRYAAQGSPYRPISAEARGVPHPPDGTVPMRAGSIRADVTRYNEERGGRPMPPPRTQEDAGRPPFFSSFYRN